MAYRLGPKRGIIGTMAMVGDILDAVDRLAPFHLAEAWDNVGLLLGDPDWPVTKVLASLDVDEAVVAEAEEVGAELILAHHPLIFKSVERVTAETQTGRLAIRLLSARRAVIAAHTNLDAAEGGLCDRLAEALDLVDLRPLRAESEGRHYKVVVFVPEDDLAPVQTAAFEAGAGRIGDYTECSFATNGTGTFRPGPGASPATGAGNVHNALPEYRLEVAVDEDRLGAVVAAIARVHRYEEPALDIYTLMSMPIGVGVGRVGRLEEPKTAARLADDLKRVLGAPAVRLGGDPRQKVERAAIVTGGGSGLVESVAGADVQAFVTGELKFHEIQNLAAESVATILGGHYATERIPLEAWVPRFADVAGVEVILSDRERGVIRTV